MLLWGGCLRRQTAIIKDINESFVQLFSSGKVAQLEKCSKTIDRLLQALMFAVSEGMCCVLAPFAEW